MDFSIVSDSQVINQCLNLSCQRCDLVSWHEMLICPLCGKTYDFEQEQPPDRVDYAPAINRLEDDSMISRIQTVSKDKPSKVTAFDDGFLKRPGVVVIDDREELPDIDKATKGRRSTTTNQAASRQDDYGRTDTRQRYQHESSAH